MQKQSKGKAARTLANMAAFESLAKMAEEPWYVARNAFYLAVHIKPSLTSVIATSE